MRAWPSAMGKNGFVGAAGFFEGICKNGQVVELLFVVAGLSEVDHGRRQPRRIENDGVKRVDTEDAAMKGTNRGKRLSWQIKDAFAGKSVYFITHSCIGVFTCGYLGQPVDAPFPTHCH